MIELLDRIFNSFWSFCGTMCLLYFIIYIPVWGIVNSIGNWPTKRPGLMKYFEEDLNVNQDAIPKS